MSKAQQRLLSIQEAMNDIEFILHNVDFKVTRAIENRILKPAIRMNIIKIAEQFNRLKDENEFALLSNFNNNDLRGLNAVRNFIAHDYDGVNMIVVEDIIRIYLPRLKEKVLEIQIEFKDD